MGDKLELWPGGLPMFVLGQGTTEAEKGTRLESVVL